MLNKMETEEIVFTFDPEDRILSVVDGNVHLRIEDEDSNDIILSIPREKYIKALNEWLDRKAEYWKNWGHYCGVGYVLVYDCVKIGIGYLSLCTIDTDEYEDVEVDIYSPKPDSEIIVDMEHG